MYSFYLKSASLPQPRALLDLLDADPFGFELEEHIEQFHQILVDVLIAAP